MLLVNNHFTLVLGIDIHFTTLPPYIPVHPYIGMVLDPSDFIPFIGSTVNINGVPRGVSDTSGIIVPLVHIPLPSPPWLLAPIIGHESTNFFASQTVFADGSRLSPKGYMVMTCNDIGVPLSLQPGTKKPWKVVPTLFAPTSYSLPLVTGAPVNVGGPYVPDWGGMLKNMAMGLGFGGLLKYGKTLFNKLLKKADGPKWLSRALCHAGFEPVNFINGAVVYDGIDFSLTGALPLEWKRSWYSDSSYQGLLGYGCHWQYDREIQYYDSDNTWGIRMEDGRVLGFPTLSFEDVYYLREEKLTIRYFGDCFQVYAHQTNLTYVFSRWSPNYFKLTRIERNAVTSIELHYEGSRLRQMVDSAGRKLHIDTDSKGRIISVVVDVDGFTCKKVSYRYDKQGNMNAITDALGQTTTMTYDQSHRMITKTDRNGQSFYWEYDTLGRCIHTWGDGGWQQGWLAYYPEKGYNQITDANGAVTTYFYDTNQLVHRIEDAMGGIRYFEYTPYMELYRQVDQDGNITGYTYNKDGFLTSITYPDGTQKHYTYDAQNRLKVQRSASGNQQVYVYDEANQVRSIIEADGNVTHYTYTEAGLLKTITRQDRHMELTYDRFDNLIGLHSDAGQAHWNYNLYGEVILSEDISGSITRYEYDALGRVTALLEPNGARYALHYNAYDEVTEIRLNGKTQVGFSYTPLGSLKQRRQGETQVNFRYDAMEQLVQITNEHYQQYTFTRNKNGEVIKEVGFDGKSTHYKRSASGKVIESYHNPKNTKRFYYNGKGQIRQIEYADGSCELYGYNADGLLISASNLESVVELERDAQGNVIKQTFRHPFDKQGQSILSTYDQEGNRTHISSSLGADITFTHNIQNHITGIQARHTPTDDYWTAAIERNALGQATAYTFASGVCHQMSYDYAGRPITHRTTDGYGRECYHRSYHWNKANQLLQSINHTEHYGTRYSYDSLNQLVMAMVGDSQQQIKQPDAVGNLFETETQTDRHYAAGGQLTKDQHWHYHYDEEGNLTNKTPSPSEKVCESRVCEGVRNWSLGSWAYEWNANGSLKKVKCPDGKEVAFAYDALGRRTKKVANGKIKRYLWDGNVLLHEWEYNVADEPQLLVSPIGEVTFDKEEPIENLITWVYESGSFVPIGKLTENERFSIVSDYIGRPVLAFDENGEKVWSAEYDIYGRIRKLQGDKAFIPFRQLGQYEDVETGLYYNRFRYYDCNTGTYISQDPIGLDGGLAFYAYVHDVNGWVDVFGLDLHHIIPQSVWKSINKNYDNVLKNIDGYVQNVSKKAKDISNLIDLDKPFHGNHPKYNEYVNERIKDLIKNNDLNLKSIKELQEELVNHINDAMKSGKTLNDYFKEGLHKICK
ncbi:DUF6531 domain-containing protein [Capnocytophaga canis]|uniref:DUF6531 domain-containing protein n=1 Tax=Capnocytophaga canis TaxID=1848903 RepID=UPI0037D1C097